MNDSDIKVVEELLNDPLPVSAVRRRVLNLDIQTVGQLIGLSAFKWPAITDQPLRQTAHGPLLLGDSDSVSRAESDLVCGRILESQHHSQPPFPFQPHPDADDHSAEDIDNDVNDRPAYDLIPIITADEINIGYRCVDLKERAWSEGFFRRAAGNFPVTQFHAPFAITRRHGLAQSMFSILLIMIFELAERKDLIRGRQDRNLYTIDDFIAPLSEVRQGSLISLLISYFPAVFIEHGAASDDGFPEVGIDVDSDRALLNFRP